MDTSGKSADNDSLLLSLEDGPDERALFVLDGLQGTARPSSIHPQIARHKGIPYIQMHTVIETPTFQKAAAKLWSDDERVAFIDWIAANPFTGDVIPGADGARKIRWSRAGTGKSGGTRVIYFNLNEDEIVLLLTVYAKAERANMSPAEISKVI